MNFVFGNQVFGTLTADDKPAIAAVLAEAGIEDVEPALSRSGTISFIVTGATYKHGPGNDSVSYPGLHQRIVDALTDAGWTWRGGITLVAGPAQADSEPEEIWTTQDVADHLGITRDAARKQLSRWGIKATYRYAEARNLYGSLFLASQVRAAHAARPGRGTRTDLA
ncbi:hypothetical protein ACFVG1_13345 [Streptomyces bacillaris]|uniref:hypothetical protein n=1 Tax=Streptomyces bacillaris TaxID=68179 RepID=UPI0035D622D6